jgi:hypothetical protein
MVLHAEVWQEEVPGMSINAAPKVALLWHGDREARDTATLGENRLRGVAEALRQIGVEAEPAVYADEFVDEVRDQLRNLRERPSRRDPEDGDEGSALPDAGHELGMRGG